MAADQTGADDDRTGVEAGLRVLAHLIAASLAGAGKIDRSLPDPQRTTTGNQSSPGDESGNSDSPAPARSRPCSKDGSELSDTDGSS